MYQGLGFGKRKVIEQIVKQNWGLKKPEDKKKFTYNDLLFVIQELMQEEGKPYMEGKSIMYGFQVFRYFVELLLYRNLANYDSMVLITAEKGCITGDALLEMPRDLKKYPKGVPLKELDRKGPQYVYSFNITTQKLEVKQCDGIEFVKNDDVWEVELTNGMTIQTTKDHPFLQIDGTYKQLKDLIWNKHIIKSGKTKGKILYNRIGAKNTDRVQTACRFGKYVNGFLEHDDTFRFDYSIKPKLKKNEKYGKEHIFIWKQLNEEIKDGYVIHHKDGNHFNNNVDNLEVITYSEHRNIHKFGNLCNVGSWVGYNRPKCLTRVGSKENKKLHSTSMKKFLNEKNNIEVIEKMQKRSKKVRVMASQTQNGGIIKSIKYIGKKDVYDVVNVKDNKNFIVNGFVVSNTGKSSAAIMLARQWCKLVGIKFDPNRHIAYNNADVMRKMDQLNKFEPLIADEAIRFASSEDWAKKENKELKKKLAQVRTKHLLYILCFPLKIYKVEKTYLENFVNYWVDLYGRGVGAIYVKDKNPVQDSWRMKMFAKIGSYTEFTSQQAVIKKLQKHPNFWIQIKFPKPPRWLYEKYMKVREANIYDDDVVLANVSQQDIHNALLVLSLRDILMHDSTLTMNRVLLHIRNEYDVSLKKSDINAAIEDAKQLVMKVREKVISA